MRLHLVALPHTQVSPAFNGCAYTAKTLKFCKMMGDQYVIKLYAPEGPSVRGISQGASGLVPCLSTDIRIQTFGPDDPHRLPAWPTEAQAAHFNQNVIHELKDRLEPHDLILLTGGWTHKPIADTFPNNLFCEPGVGYEGIFTNYCAFESYAWMHHCYAKKGINDGRFFDTVIPNFFDPAEFPHINKGNGDYLLFLGRLVQRKGPHIASEIARAAGMKLIVAGAGGKQVGTDIVAPEITIKDAEYVGPVNIEERAKLLAGARALIVPTTYIEPFGGVAVEAMMAGTPVIATDWGAFTETVKQGETGYRFRTLAEAVRAVDFVYGLKHNAIRKDALQHYSLDAVAPMYKRWFDRLSSLWIKGWYT